MKVRSRFVDCWLSDGLGGYGNAENLQNAIQAQANRFGGHLLLPNINKSNALSISYFVNR